ncbi:hypothetical protein HGRIS_003838 [Hohenbuehelia grisea]|uniref:Uncharacterized protein n=1 Tax=Hohenbuehelia grisea TaxID=104357 RepID=A0ABR3JH56_9AGAR
MANQNPAPVLVPPPSSHPLVLVENSRTTRDIYMQEFHLHYPDVYVSPRHDLDVLLLYTLVQGNPVLAWDGRRNVVDWLDDALELLLGPYEDKVSGYDHIMAWWKPILDAPHAIQVGTKPLPGTRDGHLIQVLPIPGSVYSVRLFPGNEFQRFELRAVGNPAKPWLPRGELLSLGKVLGLQDVPEDVIFTIPLRVGWVQAPLDAIVLN